MSDKRDTLVRREARLARQVLAGIDVTSISTRVSITRNYSLYASSIEKHFLPRRAQLHVIPRTCYTYKGDLRETVIKIPREDSSTDVHRFMSLAISTASEIALLKPRADYLPFQKNVLVFLGEFPVNSHEIVGIATGTRASSSRLNAEDVVQNGADEVVVEERAARMAHHEREDGKPLDVLRRAAE